MTNTKAIETKKKGLYLQDVASYRNVVYSSNNLILSPVGSGKTHYIFNCLSPKYEGWKLMLVSTTSLKDSLKKEDGTFTTKDLEDRRREFNIKDKNMYIMTYAEFANKVLWDIDGEFISKFSVIFCDEIHSLFDYYTYGRSQRDKLTVAMSELFKKYEDKDIYYFTATDEKIVDFANRNGEALFKHVTKFDYREEENIMEHKNMYVIKYSKVDEILDSIDNLEDFKEMEAKGFIYNEKISGMKKIEDLLTKKGYKVGVVWSVNNKKYIMDEKQLELRKTLLEEGMIPDEYDFIIFNGSMREGWNLLDKRVKFVALDTLSETGYVQARGRLRFDAEIVMVRVEETSPIEIKAITRINNTGLVKEVLGKELTASDKRELCNNLGIIKDDGRVMMWPGLSEILEANGYNVQNTTKRVNGKVTRLTIITKADESELRKQRDLERQKQKKALSRETSLLVSNLKAVGFERLNANFLRDYDENREISVGVAYNNIKSSYVNLVKRNNYTIQEFMDLTYYLARSNKKFTKNNYITAYHEYYNNKNGDVIMAERAKYDYKEEYERRVEEKREQENLMAYINGETVEIYVKEKDNKELSEEELELLEYIKINGGLA